MRELKYKARVVIFIFFLIPYISVLFSYSINAQSSQEIMNIDAANAEYDRTHPLPDHSPPPINSTWTETFVTANSLKILTQSANIKTVVYYEKDRNVYHMGYCKTYAEKSGGDYSRPAWFCEAILNGTRCADCISDNDYRICKEALYRTNEASYKANQAMYQEIINKKNKIIKIMSVIIVLFIIIDFVWLALSIKKRNIS